MPAPPAISPASAPRDIDYIANTGSDTRRERGDRCSLGSSMHGRENQARNRHRKYGPQHLFLSCFYEFARNL